MDYKAGFVGLIIGLVVGYLVKTFLKGKPQSASQSRTERHREDPHREFNELVASRKKSTVLPPKDTQPEPVIAPTPSVTSTMPPSPNEAEDTTAHTVSSEVQFDVASVAASSLPTQFFGPSPEKPYIEVRKLSSQSLPQMPVCLTLKTPHATVGTFMLNPYAEQSRLIGNGIRELKTFFDFDLPLPDYFTSIKTTKLGKMELRNDEWHLIEKAKIELK